MDQPKKCPKCQTEMVSGMLIDHGHANTRQKQVWCQELKPKFAGLVTQMIDGREVVTYCCPSCKFLESYAEGEASS